VNVVIDIGNTRIKWAWADGVELQRPGSAAHSPSVGEALRALEAALPPHAERVLIANVAGRELGEQVRALISRRLGIAAELAATAVEQCGVRCAYADPSRLGVDRWAASIAAFRRIGGAVCVIGAGTAVTFDAVDGAGRHLGGLILAGGRLVARALLDGTNNIGATSGTAESARGLELLAWNTDDAVSRGAMLAIAAGLDRAVREVTSALGTPAPVLLTGGDADVLRPWLETAVQLEPHLVLEGLASMASEGDA
jgi:type III pantothenate kinase